MIQRVTPMPMARQISATHHLPGFIGSTAGSSLDVPVTIALVRACREKR